MLTAVVSVAVSAITVLPPAAPATATGHPTNTTITGSSDETTHLVTVDSAATLQRAIESVERMGGAVDQVFDTVLLGLAVRLRDDGLDALTRLPGVAVVDEEVTVSSTAEQANPPSWGLDRIDQTALPLDDRYTYLSSGAGVTVYVVDSGIRPTHNEFAGRIPYGAVYDYDRVPWERWSGSVTSGFEDCASGAGHGTHVAGIVGGSTYGVAKSVTVIPVKVLDCAGNGTDTAVIAASEWIAQDAASRGPAVVVMSLGG
ncbi:MAG: S8 family serine peptidase, partial [Ilumatobacteraceae bacterium]